MKATSKIFTALLAAALFVAAGCSNVLEEDPKSVLLPSFFKTAAGINSGLVAIYSYNKFYYGTEGGMNTVVYGTDEFTNGQQVTNPPLNVYQGLNSGNGDILTPWNRAYPAINTANGVIELGREATDITEAAKIPLIAEAKFLRAQWYFILVQTFGPVTLDFGAGPLKFNQVPTNQASRAPVSEVYAAIIKDLTEASAELPDRPSVAGRVWKASALHLLAKAYLTRAWIDNSQADFQAALDAAKKLIDNRGTYGVSLLPNYADVHREGNEHNSEVLFQVEWMDNQTFNNTQANGLQGDEGARQNKSNFLFRCFYSQNVPGMVRDVANGRSFVRYKPTPWLLDGAFADKVNDTRYNKSFQFIWRCNSPSTINPKWTQAEADEGIIPQNKVGTAKLASGDTALYCVPAHLAAKFSPLKDRKPYLVFLPTEATDQKKYFFRDDPDGSGAQIGPSGINTPASAYDNFGGVNNTNKYYPTLKKYDATQARAGNDPNISSVRPFIVYRFAETYLIAAEAALKLGQSGDAVTYLNVVRQRAGDTDAAKTALGATTAADLAAGDIDYILDERSRELAGEQMRWFDLVRTKRLIDRVTAHNAQAAPGIKPFHVLRPIPQAQIDLATDPSSENGKYPQNDDYQ
jgi:starch-binding outer membrane protein, SusD/RagB family